VLSSAALAGVISENAVQAAPAGLALTITVGAVQGTALSVSTLALAKGVASIMTWTTTVKITAGVAVAVLIGYQAYEQVDQRQQITVLQQQLQQAQAGATAQQATIDRLQQEKNALVEEKRREDLDALKIINRQKAAANASVAQAEAIAKGSVPETLAKLLGDPAQKEMLRMTLKQNAKTSYSALAKALKLSPDDADKLFDLIANKNMKQQERLVALMQGKMDIDTALQARADDKTDLMKEIAAAFGDDAAAQFDQANHKGFASNIMKSLNYELGANQLDKEQSKQYQKLLQAAPTFTLDQTDLFRSAASLDAFLQQIADRDQHVLDQASGFLTPEQIAAIKAANINKINTWRQQFSLGQQFIQRNVTGK